MTAATEARPSFTGIQSSGITRRQFLDLAGGVGAGLLLASCSPESGSVEQSSPPFDTPSARENTTIYGVTLDRINNLDDSIKALRYLPERTTVRLVFDEYMEPSVYADAIDNLHPVADIMGGVLDSAYVHLYPTKEYRERTEEYIAAFAGKVTIWEIGNEVNGEWVLNEDEPRSAVADKVTAAYNAVQEQGGRTAITLYYNEDCWERPEHEMFRWIEENLSEHIREGLDYVFVSYYEEDCNGLRPDWQAVFERLREHFPSAYLGFGEVGTTDHDDKANYLRRYYTTAPDVGGFVGGYFWWYFYPDMVEPYAEGDTRMLDVLAKYIQQ